MAFGGKVKYGTGFVVCEQFGHQLTVANVALHKHMVLIAF
jgi:hypothetical protein